MKSFFRPVQQYLERLCNLGENIKRRSISPLPHRLGITPPGYHDLSPLHVVLRSGPPSQSMVNYDPGQPSILSLPSHNSPSISTPPIDSKPGWKPPTQVVYLPGEPFLVSGKTEQKDNQNLIVLQIPI